MYVLPDDKVGALQRVAGRLGDSGWCARTSKDYGSEARFPIMPDDYRFSLPAMHWVPVVKVTDIGYMRDPDRRPEPLTKLDLWALDHLAQVSENGYYWDAKETLR